MDTDLAQKAITSAITGDWKKALEINSLILKKNPQDIDALNRIARAYSELGEVDNARKSANKVLKLDPFNSIAQKSLYKWKGLKNGDTTASSPPSAEEFLEEPGKTKMVNLLHLSGDDNLAKLDSGDEVVLNPHGHRITITSSDGAYIGKLPDDLSVHLRKLIKYGNKYKVFIKNIEPKCVKIFIRETQRAKELSDVPSFSAEKIDYVSFTPPELVHKKDNVYDGGEDEEN